MPKLKQGAVEFKRVIDSIHANKAAPPIELNGNLGEFKDKLQLLLDTLRASGYEKFQIALTALLAADRDVMVALSQPTEEQEADARLTKGGSGKKVFKRLTEDDIEQFPDLSFLVQNILPEVAVSLMFGPSGTGKTFNALHFAQCIARGYQWFGRNVKTGNVLYIYAEGKLGLKPRLRAIRKHYGWSPTNKISYIGVPIHLRSDRQTLIDTIDDMITGDERPVLIIVDTFSNCSDGTDQNEQKAVAQVLAVCHEICDQYALHVMVIHHTNKAGDFNGTMAFKNHVDSMIELVEDNGFLLLHCEKQRDGAEKFPDIKLSLKQVELDVDPETLVASSSCVVVAVETRSVQEAKAEVIEAERAQMLAVVETHSRINVTRWIAECKGVGISKRAFYNHLPYLEQSKRVHAFMDGKSKVYELARGNGNA